MRVAFAGQPRVELVQTRLRAIRPAEPDRALADEIADDDAVGVSLLDRYLVEPDALAGWASRPAATARACTAARAPSRCASRAAAPWPLPDRRGPTAPPHVEGEALRVEGIVGQEVDCSCFTVPQRRQATRRTSTRGRCAGRRRRDRGRGALAIVPPALRPAAGPARRFFDRRVSVMMRAWGSPKIPVTVGLGRNPGKRYASHSRRERRGVGMRRSCPILAPRRQCFHPLPERVPHPQPPLFTHSLPRRARFGVASPQITEGQVR